jgi:hypothetical protein
MKLSTDFIVNVQKSKKDSPQSSLDDLANLSKSHETISLKWFNF